MSIDPNAAGPSRNLDYLLEDEEPRHGGGGWKAVVIFLALILAVGLGYLRWKNQGFAFLNPGGEKHAPAADNASTSNAPTVPAAAGNSAAAPTDANAPSNATTAGGPSAGTSTPNATTPAGAAGAPSTAPVGNAPATQTSAPSPAQSATPNTPNANPSASGPATNAPASAAASNPPAGPKSPSEAATPLPDASPAAGAAANENDDQPKPAAAVVKPKPVDPVAEAHKYLYGDGAAQNCDRGLKMLKPAADRGNAKAMVEMGALYSAGLCTPKDLPTAYRWFAMALRKEPDNNDVQTDLQKLWGEMTQPERKLAIQLSQ